MNAVETFLLHMDERASVEDYNDASGLLVETTTPLGFSQLIGPFPKDTADAFEAIERLRAEDLPEDEPATYEIRFLFPPRFADVPEARS